MPFASPEYSAQHPAIWRFIHKIFNAINAFKADRLTFRALELLCSGADRQNGKMIISYRARQRIPKYP